MQRNENIFIKLGIKKNFSTGRLSLDIQFDTSSDNFKKEKDIYSWCPTDEEWAFANEAFELLSKVQPLSDTERKANKQKDVDKVEEYTDKSDEHDLVNRFLEKTKKV
ncbi:MAG: hypothetical protein R6V50_02780 [Thermoplasmatota archaeon]